MNEAIERVINDVSAALKAVALAKLNFNNAKAALEQAEAKVVEEERKLREALNPGYEVSYRWVAPEQPPYPLPSPNIVSLEKQKKFLKESLDKTWTTYRNCRSNCTLPVDKCVSCTRLQKEIGELEQKLASIPLPVDKVDLVITPNYWSK